MSEPISISSAPPALASMNYTALREGGMALIRKWAGESWTDHNIHDPGITILEACSYAMTELGLRLQLDIGDLLRSGESIKNADLAPADRVMPVGPVTPDDLRRVLLDHPLVRDAQLFLPADGEVLLYGPPLTYTPGSSRIRPGGLYEVLVELADPDLEQDLNSNTYSFQVTSGGQSYDVDIALPFWDDVEAAPFREGAVVTAAAMVLDGGQAWRALPEPQSFFGKIDITYQTTAGTSHVMTWAVLQVTSAPPQPGAVLPGILTAAQTAVETVAAPNAPLVPFADRVRRAAAAVTQLQTYLAGWRNLGEQAVRIGVPRVQEVAVRARIEVTGGIDVEQLVANIFVELDKMLSPRVRFESLSARRSTTPDPDAIYDGPLLRNGFLATDALDMAHPSVLFLSDVLRVIMRQRSAAGTDVVTQENPAGRDIVAVTDLALTNYINNRPITSDAENCLTLVETERYRPRLSAAKSRLVLVRTTPKWATTPSAWSCSSRTHSRRWTRHRARTTRRRCGPCRAAICCRSTSTPRSRKNCRPSTASVTRCCRTVRGRAGWQACGSCRGTFSSSSRCSRTSPRSSRTSTGSFQVTRAKTPRTSRGPRSTCRVCRAC